MAALDLSTPIASPTEFRERNGRVSSNDDTMVREGLLTMTRVVERRIGLAPGMLLPQPAQTRTFCGTGLSLLRLRDARGFQSLLRTATAIGVDSENDGTFDGYSWVLGTTSRLRGFPVDAVTMNEAYTALELLNGAPLPTWTDGVEVRVTGDMGLAADSPIRVSLKERVIALTRELLDAHHAGGAMSLNAVDDAIQTMPAARSLMHMIEREYPYAIVSFG